MKKEKNFSQNFQRIVKDIHIYLFTPIRSLYAFSIPTSYTYKEITWFTHEATKVLEVN